MRILFLHHNQPDYLVEGLFHGLRTVLGSDCVDVPRYDSMYSPLSEEMRERKLTGHGFTLFGLLRDIDGLAEQRYFWRKDIADYDRVVVGNIWWTWELVLELSKILPPEKLVILDGEDDHALFPFAWRLRGRPWAYMTPAHRYLYFKRELAGEGLSYGPVKLLPRSLRSFMRLPRNARPISFSIPEEKLFLGDSNHKSKDFPTYIVDREVAKNTINSRFSATGTKNYAFTCEADYYKDIQESRFGITTKRAGWDCLRHYELAANGAILCFRDLDAKPETCAPHGLDGKNCIIYHSYAELAERIANIDETEYALLYERTKAWIRNQTTRARAHEFLQQIGDT